jgi:predicted kinase
MAIRASSGVSGPRTAFHSFRKNVAQALKDKRATQVEIAELIGHEQGFTFSVYPSVLSLLEGRLRAGALIVADNANASPEYLARVRSMAHGYLSVPFADDVELSMRLGMAVP